MKRIEITTAHNIVVTHELATIPQRILAWLLDATILGTYAAIIGAIFQASGVLFYVFVILVLIFYHLVFEIFNRGQTLGKRALRLRVVSVYGVAPTIEAYFLRWTFRIVDITFTLGTLSILSLLSSPRGQRIGDKLAGTTVINLGAGKMVELDHIQELSVEFDEIKYPDLINYSDKDMLLIKHTLERYKKDPHRANRDLLTDLSGRLAADLQLGKKRRNHVVFLNEILREYIIITR